MSPVRILAGWGEMVQEGQTVATVEEGEAGPTFRTACPE